MSELGGVTVREEMGKTDVDAPDGTEAAASQPVDGWGVRRAEALTLLSEAELISKPNPAESQTLALIGIGHALLALDDRLVTQPPPVWVVNSSGDLESDRQFVDQLRRLVHGEGAFGRGDEA